MLLLYLLSNSLRFTLSVWVEKICELLCYYFWNSQIPSLTRSWTSHSEHAIQKPLTFHEIKEFENCPPNMKWGCRNTTTSDDYERTGNKDRIIAKGCWVLTGETCTVEVQWYTITKLINYSSHSERVTIQDPWTSKPIMFCSQICFNLRQRLLWKIDDISAVWIHYQFYRVPISSANRNNMRIIILRLTPEQNVFGTQLPGEHRFSLFLSCCQLVDT